MTLNSDPCSRSKASQREHRYLNDGVYSFPRFATSPLLMVGTFPPSRFSTFNLSGVKPSSSDLGKQRDQFSLVNLWARRNNSSDTWASTIILHQKHSAVKLVSVWEKPGCVLSALCRIVDSLAGDSSSRMGSAHTPTTWRHRKAWSVISFSCVFWVALLLSTIKHGVQGLPLVHFSTACKYSGEKGDYRACS